MAGLTQLRRLVYERDKHDAGWDAADGVSMAYVLGHTCAADTLRHPHGRKRTDARPLRHGYGNGRGHGGGNGSGHGNGNGYGHGNGYGGDGDGNGYGRDYGRDYGNGNANGYADGNGDGVGFARHPWQI